MKFYEKKIAFVCTKIELKGKVTIVAATCEVFTKKK